MLVRSDILVESVPEPVSAVQPTMSPPAQPQSTPRLLSSIETEPSPMNGSSRKQSTRDASDIMEAPKDKQRKSREHSDRPPICSQLEPGAGPYDLPGLYSTVLKSTISKIVSEQLEKLAQQKRRSGVGARRRLDQKIMQIAAFLAMIPVYDPEVLSSLIWKTGALPASLLKICGPNATTVLDYWAEIHTNLKSNGAEQGSGDSKCERCVEQSVTDWYQETCIITGNTDPLVESYRIVPECEHSDWDRSRRFWAALTHFVRRRLCDRMRGKLHNPVRQKENLFVLDRNSYKLWIEGKFGLFGLRNSTGFRNSFQTTIADPIPGEAKATITNHRVGNREPAVDTLDENTPRVIQHGDVIHLRTYDRARFPLPCLRLVELRWRLDFALRASASDRILDLLFRCDFDRDETGKSQDPPEPRVCDFRDDLRDVTWYSRYLIARAVETGRIDENEVPIWKKRLRWSRFVPNVRRPEKRQTT